MAACEASQPGQPPLPQDPSANVADALALIGMGRGSPAAHISASTDAAGTSLPLSVPSAAPPAVPPDFAPSVQWTTGAAYAPQSVPPDHAPPAFAPISLPALAPSSLPPPPPTSAMPDHCGQLATCIGLKVEQEDFLLQGDTSLFLPGVQPLSTAPELGRIRGEVYVQAAKDATRFRPVPAERVQRAYKIGAAHARGGPSDRTARSRNRILHDSLSSTLEGCIWPLDPDASFLQLSDPSELSVFDLLLGTKKCEVLAKLLFFACQCCLGGLCVAMGLVAGGAEGDSLAVVLGAVEPGLSRCALVLGEVVLVSSLLDAFSTYESLLEERQKAARSSYGVGLDNSGSNEQGFGTSNARAAIRQALRCSLTVAANAGLVLVCLLGAKGDIVLRHGHLVAVDSADATWSWDARRSRSLMTAASVCGLLATAFAVPRGLELLASSQLAPMLKHASDLEASFGPSFLGADSTIADASLLANSVPDQDTSWRS